MRTLAIILALAVATSAQAWTFTDDLGRQVEVPDQPTRIVSADDVYVTVPLLELGVVPVGSQGRPMRSGGAFLRSSLQLTGIDFANSDMTFLGADPIDVESIVAVHPDLIITTTSRSVPPEMLSQIAPTVVLDVTRHTPRELYRIFATLVGRQARADQLEAQYAVGLDILRWSIEGRAPVISVFDATEGGKIAVYHTYGALGEVLRDAGIGRPPIIDSIPAMESLELSPEILPELDADIIIGTWRDDKPATPQAARDALTAIVPDYCNILTACQAGRMYFLPRDVVRSNTYAARMMMIAFLSGVIPATPR